MKSILIVCIILALLSPTHAGPISYGICQSGCSGLVVVCYAAAGFTFGTITAGVGTPAALLACNAGFGMCSAKCAVVTLFAPIP